MAAIASRRARSSVDSGPFATEATLRSTSSGEAAPTSAHDTSGLESTNLTPHSAMSMPVSSRNR